MNRALFPLPVFLLPGGITRLRVFEARYIRLVQESAGDIGFVIVPLGNLPIIDGQQCLETQEVKKESWGSFVKIIDFEKGEDGLLLIDVMCENLVHIQSVEQEQDGLRKADIALLDDWVNDDINQSKAYQEATNTLSLQLKQIFDLNPELEDLYAETHFDDPVWVCQRWLELLPLSPQEMNVFVQPAAFNQSIQFLTSVVKQPET